MNENLEQLKKIASIFKSDNIITSAEIEQVLIGITKILSNFKKSTDELNSETRELVDVMMDKISEKHQEIIEDLLVPYISPTFASFSISGQSTTMEVGDSLSGSKNFTWTFTTGSNVSSNTVDISDLTAPATLFTNISNTPPQAYNFTPAIKKTTATSHSWRASATNTQAVAFNSSNFTIS